MKVKGLTNDVDVKPLHSTGVHQRKVRKITRITSEDMHKLDVFRSRVMKLKERHEKLWSEYDIWGV